MMQIQDAKQFGRVAVVMGGDSAEREVSLNSGGNVLAALQSRGVDAHGVDGIPNLLGEINKGRFSRVFNILHGRGGEDGTLQGALNALNIPYTGSGVLGSALSMDKVRTKWVWQSQALPTPLYATYRKGADLKALVAELELPVIVKPAREGSSVGISRVHTWDDLGEAVQLAAQYDDELLIEQLIIGDEYTVGILGEQALPSIRIVPAGAYYDYHAKYIAEDTQYLTQTLAERDESVMCALALSAFQSTGARGWGRVDLMRDRQGKNWLLEVNTTPGMTSHSLVPKAARAMGIDFESLCWRILETSVLKGGA
jgi:D-alanine-D-alanine ligase